MLPGAPHGSSRTTLGPLQLGPPPCRLPRRPCMPGLHPCMQGPHPCMPVSPHSSFRVQGPGFRVWGLVYSLGHSYLVANTLHAGPTPMHAGETPPRRSCFMAAIGRSSQPSCGAAIFVANPMHAEETPL